MTREKAQQFVHFGAGNYIKLRLLRQMVPCYLFLTFFVLVAAIAGDAVAWAIITAAVAAVYSGVVYTFHKWCPRPSFACRFAMNAFSSFSLSAILQLFAFSICHIGEYITAFDIFLIIVLQLIASVVFVFIIRTLIKKEKLKARPGGSAVSGMIVAGGASSGVIIARSLRNRLDDRIAANILVALVSLLAVLCTTLAVFHLLKYYYAKKYKITCDDGGDTTSPYLFAEKKPKKSALRKFWSVVWRLLVLVFLILVLVGIYQNQNA